MKLVVVSNRLPVTITRRNDNTYDYNLSSGGLVSALAALKSTIEFHWVGWPGISSEFSKF